MFNIGGGELLVIMLVALLVLGPDKLPEAARKMGNVAGELRRMSSGFQREMREAMIDPTETAARERGRAVAPPPSTAAPSTASPSAASPSAGEGKRPVGSETSAPPAAAEGE